MENSRRPSSEDISLTPPWLDTDKESSCKVFLIFTIYDMISYQTRYIFVFRLFFATTFYNVTNFVLAWIKIISL